MSATIDSFNVHAARVEDYEALLAFALMAIGESAIQDVSDQKVGDLVHRCINRDRAIAGVISSKAGIEASIGLVIDQFDYSDDDHVRTVWLGVHPAFRRSNHGARLMEFAKCFQQGMGMPLFINLLTSNQLEAKMHMLLRMAPQVGASFSYGGVPEGAFSQRHVGDDPHQRKKRERRNDAADGHRHQASRPAA